MDQPSDEYMTEVQTAYAMCDAATDWPSFLAGWQAHDKAFANALVEGLAEGISKHRDIAARFDEQEGKVRCR